MGFEIFMEVESLEDRDSLIKKIRKTENELVKHPVRARHEIAKERIYYGIKHISIKVSQRKRSFNPVFF
jgi:hypothetical protein